MSDEIILDLFDDVCHILNRLRSELSCIQTSDTGSDPNSDTEESIDELREKIADLRANERTSGPNPQPSSIQHKKESS
jgi:hypothetical protein